jgi:hypothetical protein
VMDTKGRRFLLAAGVLGSILAGSAPALAQHGGGHASGGGSGGGGHASGGGGHASGGGYSGGGGHASGGGGHFGGGGHVSAGAHLGGGAHYAPAPGHYGGGGYARGYTGGYAAHAAYGRPGAYYGHGGYNGRGAGYYGHGYSTGAYWRGGYWHGGFWPRCYYGVGFSWFLPILPLAYATYWYGGIPYYYANDVYYTYNPSYEGYVATDPPPVAESSGSADVVPPSAGPAPGDTAAGAVGQIYMYPKNGQSPEQQATDKAECQQWAAQQAGQVAQNSADYQRAMTACVEGRGYSAR